MVVDERILVSEFIEFFFRVARADLARFAPGTAQANINLEILSDLAVPVPPRAEVDEIVRLLRKLHVTATELIGQTSCAAERIEQFEQSVLAKTFRGELVLQDPNDEPAIVLLERIRAARAEAPEISRRGGRPQPAKVPTLSPTSNGHRSTVRRDELELDLVVAALQQGEQRLAAADIIDVTSLDASAVKQALQSLVAAGQVRVHGKPRGTAYEWIA